MNFLLQMNPTILKFGVLEVRWYGLMYLIGFIIGTYLLKRFSKEKLIKLTVKQIDNLVTYLLIGMIVGCRVFYCFVYDPTFNILHDPLQLFRLWEGGLSFHGGLIGMIIATLIFCFRFKFSFLNLLDAITIAGVQGLFFGRFGNFINKELYGRVTDSVFGIVFPTGGNIARHPSQIYEAFGEGLLIFLVLFFLRKRLMKTNGLTFSIFILMYGMVRFFLEYFREPDAQLGFVLFKLSMGQILCLMMVILGSLMVAYSLLRKKS